MTLSLFLVQKQVNGLEPQWRHLVVVIEQDTFIPALYWFNLGRTVPIKLKDCLWDVKNQLNKQMTRGNKTFRPQDVSPLVVSPLFSTLVVSPPIP